METVIKIEGLYKEYKLGLVGRGTLYRDLQSWWAKIRKKEDPNTVIGHNVTYDADKNSFLALNNLNLEIKKGQVLGIIGSNGAGKSTLLKILSRITSPTKGSVKIKGKIASLLEVGTGFHSELTGRENIYLNGTINGMTKKEITLKLNDIVKFAGVENFLDTPVKRYSSGMFVRLGFAVAAYLDPDILIVDEVLAVGDHSFQKKAINKMHSVSKDDGRTVLFVSHNMDSIKKLCNKVLILDQGKILDYGDTSLMISKYLNTKIDIRKKYRSVSWKKEEYGPGAEILKLESLRTLNSKNELCKNFSISEDIFIEINFWVLKDDYQVCSTLQFFSREIPLFSVMDKYIEGEWGKQKNYEKGLYSMCYTIPKNLLNEGIIDFNVVIFLPPGDLESSFQIMHPKRAIGALSFNVIDDYVKNSSRGSYPFDWERHSLLRPKINAEIKRLK